ncbi:hypothetical protein FRB96_004231 [Tulasnella sp. 330]|nr:hypothetical protein FRB96_004231 [Tulasnella sp. 330]KAG8875261.1 hypothetical protein FRB97_005314 [Tulasnella sp. 331]KAG8880194.1 hypothetical protein FRB98_005294 [Tulasnella sp. 332]
MFIPLSFDYPYSTFRLRQSATLDRMNVSVKDTNVDDGAATKSTYPSSAALASSLDDYEDDITAWVNDLLDFNSESTAAPKDLSSLDKQVQLLATRLDVASQDTSSQLEQVIDDISRTVPRLTYDLQFMRESALSLQDALQVIDRTRQSAETPTRGATEDTQTVDMSTKQVLERLHYLDTVKTALEKTYSVLREAESWSTLDSEITTLISTQSYAPAASRLSEASRSLALFSNTPEYETRRALMISLQNQLEAALSSALVAAINKRDVASCKSYYDIFNDIQREIEFRNYYFGSRRKKLVELWTDAKLLDCAGEVSTIISESANQNGSQNLNFSSLLQTFFSDFHALLVEERSFTTSIFPDPQQTLSSFVQSVIDALHPSLSERLSSMSEHYGPLSLPHLIKAFKLAEEFAVSTDKIMQSVGYSSLYSKSTAGGGGDEKPSARRLSKRTSLSRRMGPARPSSIAGPQGLGGPIGGSGAWEQVLFEPFIDFQSDYSTLEQKFLQEGLNKIVKGGGSGADSGIENGARILRDRSAAVFDMAEETLERCMAFTHGYGALGLMQAFDHAFTVLLDATKTTILVPKLPKSSAQSDASTGGGAGGAGGAEYQDLDYSAEDWEAFQQSLHLLETCRAMHDRLRNVDAKMKTTFLQFAGMVQLSRVDPSGLYISGTTKGEVQLLTQSTLNSAELHGFLEALIRESQQGGAAVVATPTPTPTPTPSSSGKILASPLPSVETTQVGSGGQLLLKGAASAITSFTQAVQLFLQNIILSPLHGQLGSYANLASWALQQRPKVRGGSAFIDHQAPTFSLSPTPTIQHVSEGLLNLPRMFELHADDDALAFSIETLPFVDKESLRRLLAGGAESENAGGGGETGLEASPKPTRRRLSSNSSAGTAGRIQIPPPPTMLPFTLTPEMVSSTWLSSLTLSLLSHLTTNVLPAIRLLSSDGAAQLASDLGYLANIVRAMNVEWDELDKWRELSEMSDEDGKKKVADILTAREDMESVMKSVGRMRGWMGAGGL